MIRFMKKVSFLFLLSSFFTSPLLADEGGPDGPSFNYWGEFVNMLVTLGIIIVMVIASVWILKRIMRSRMRNLNHSTGIKLLERRSLSSKSSLYLVDILGKAVVISESPAGVQLITELPPETNVEELLETKQEKGPSFTETLQKKLKTITQRRNESS
ncbi:MAG: hypothetical protein K1000chlam4_00404 [Chlamydiae bacterium]|nr:hypothetical protein [Chlamydiota bacterium]